MLQAEGAGVFSGISLFTVCGVAQAGAYEMVQVPGTLKQM